MTAVASRASAPRGSPASLSTLAYLARARVEIVKARLEREARPAIVRAVTFFAQVAAETWHPIWGCVYGARSERRNGGEPCRGLAGLNSPPPG